MSQRYDFYDGRIDEEPESEDPEDIASNERIEERRYQNMLESGHQPRREDEPDWGSPF